MDSVAELALERVQAGDYPHTFIDHSGQAWVKRALMREMSDVTCDTAPGVRENVAEFALACDSASRQQRYTYC